MILAQFFIKELVAVKLQRRVDDSHKNIDRHIAHTIIFTEAFLLWEDESTDNKRKWWICNFQTALERSLF